MSWCRARETSSGCDAHQAIMRSNLRVSSAMALISISSASMISGSRMEIPAWHISVPGKLRDGPLWLTDAILWFLHSHASAKTSPLRCPLRQREAPFAVVGAAGSGLTWRRSARSSRSYRRPGADALCGLCSGVGERGGSQPWRSTIRTFWLWRKSTVRANHHRMVCDVTPYARKPARC